MENVRMKKENGEIQAKLAEYFGNVEYKADIRFSGMIAMIDVRYKDFKPMVTVRRELEDLIPMSWINVSERWYSDEVLKEELMKLYDNDVEVIDEGRNVGLIVLIEEKLFDRTIA